MRVTDADIQAIRPTTVDTLPFIAVASLLVDQYVGAAGWSLAMAVEIERWLTAHLMEVAAPMATQRRLGTTDVRYEQAQLGEGLKATRFGQQVLLLDTSGMLAGQGSLLRATFDVF